MAASIIHFTLGLIVLALVASAAAKCENKSPFCGPWKLWGYCKPASKHYQWMKENCPQSCRIPCPTKAPPPSSCSDIDGSYCQSMKANCNKDHYKDYLMKYCKKTCNFCGAATAPPSTSSPSVDTSKCGIRGDGHTRIVGGSNAKPGDWPWQVQIDFHGDYNRYWCGGTLLNDEWILSAAHCFEDDVNPRKYTIYLGEHDIRVKSSNEQKHKIAEIIMHPNYDPSAMSNDMALLRLKKKASLNYFVRPACFPDASVDFSVGEECYITGWGALRTSGPSPRILQQAKIPLVSRSTCDRAMGRGTITKSMICAGYGNKAIDSCQGDSGGPLVCRKRNSSGDVWYLWGVVSWGYDCAKPGTYGVYASTKHLNQWVSNIAFKSK